jgi:GGDEF domain-containing protein
VSPAEQERLKEKERELLRLERAVADLAAQLARANAELQRERALATVDPRTGCLVERALLDRLGYEIARAARFRRELALALVRFDTAARTGGPAPELLELCRANARHTDLIGLSADGEVAFILPETPIEGALVFAQRFRDRAGRQEARVGCAAWPGDGRGAAELVAAARRAIAVRT